MSVHWFRQDFFFQFRLYRSAKKLLCFPILYFKNNHRNSIFKICMSSIYLLLIPLPNNCLITYSQLEVYISQLDGRWTISIIEYSFSPLNKSAMHIYQNLSLFFSLSVIYLFSILSGYVWITDHAFLCRIPASYARKIS